MDKKKTDFHYSANLFTLVSFQLSGRVITGYQIVLSFTVMLLFPFFALGLTLSSPAHISHVKWSWQDAGEVRITLIEWMTCYVESNREAEKRRRRRFAVSFEKTLRKAAGVAATESLHTVLGFLHATVALPLAAGALLQKCGEHRTEMYRSAPL